MLGIRINSRIIQGTCIDLYGLRLGAALWSQLNEPGRVNDAGADRLMTNPRLCFVDSVGTDWRIYEVASVNVPAPRGRNCLIFESAQAVRRVWNYPNNWHNLSSDELSALSWNT